jgi:two-component system chemotaxis response regulator CheB
LQRLGVEEFAMSVTPLRVLIVDDSRLFRSAVEAALSGREEVRVVGSVFSGEKALEFLALHPIDLVTLDVEMPGMDGLATLQEIQKLNQQRAGCRPIGVLMLSAHTRAGADVTIQALQAGAFDFVPKPALGSEEANQAWLAQQLMAKIRAFRNPSALPEDRPTLPAVRNSGLRRPVQAVFIAVSTGGPHALGELIPALAARIEVPVLIVQHMPAGFIGSLASRLSRGGVKVVEAIDAQPLAPRTCYLAPSGKHLIVRRIGGVLHTGLLETPPENRCRPSADVLFRSAAAELSGSAIAVVMTGMGCDGTAGLAVLKRAGGYAIAQDEATSTVWGMPGSVVEARLADAVVPLGRIADVIAREIQARVGG